MTNRKNMKNFDLKKYLAENKLLLEIKDGIEVTKKNDDEMGVDIYSNGEKIGKIGMDGDGIGNSYTIVGADIDKKYRGKGLYQKALLQILDKFPSISIYSAFRSPEASRAWIALRDKMDNSYDVFTSRQDGEIVYKLKKKK
jgi:hypothetical protein